LEGTEMGIKQHVETEGNIELLVVDPFFEGEDCSVVYLKLSLGVFE
jgi:hypothetical protein